MPEEFVLHLRGETDCSLCRKVLRGYRERKSHDAEADKHEHHSDNVALVGIADTVVDDGSYDQRNEKFQQGFKQLEQRAEHAFLLVAFDVLQKFEQINYLPFNNVLDKTQLIVYHKRRIF